MSYEHTDWKTGDIVTSAKLNKIEGGVSEVAEAYEPTVWKTGDVVTSAKLNKIEQALADATAESWVTVFDGEVTTEGSNPVPMYGLTLSEPLTATNIRITFNGQVYECAKQTVPFTYYGTDFTADPVDWATYPFSVADASGGIWYLATESAGTYTVKIEANSSAQVLRFANISVSNPAGARIEYVGIDNGILSVINIVESTSSGFSIPIQIPLIDAARIHIYISQGSEVTCTGEIELESGNQYLVRGDGTININ